MLTKAEKTTQLIIEKVAPYFNKHGYTGTSMSDICKATGLTKGAIYGNFKNKEELALKSFNHIMRKEFAPLNEDIAACKTGMEKMYAITNFYRHKYDAILDAGGCPVLNVGLDSVHQNHVMYERVKEIIAKLSAAIQSYLQEAIEEGDFKPDLDTGSYASQIYSQIQGCIFLAVMMKDKHPIYNMMDSLDRMIENELKI